MWWPFKKKKIKPEPDSIVGERWETDFSDTGDPRFKDEEEESYSCRITSDGLKLSLKRRNLFAWTLSRPYRYRNFVLTMKIHRSDENGHSAAGMVMRYADETTYYYVMVSSGGVFRFDVVFNGTPRTLIPWTNYRESNTEEVILTVVAHGTFFAIFINDIWVGEVDDETIDAGYFGFAGQNYQERDQAEFTLKQLSIESEDIRVEEFYDTRVKGDDIPAENRKLLAERLTDSGQYSAALIQLRKSFTSRMPEIDDFFHQARIYNFLNLEHEALNSIERCFPEGRNRKDIVLEKAGILYRMNRFLELKGFLLSTLAVWEEESLGWNLLGNAEDALGNFDTAYEYYEKADNLDPGNGIYDLNAARVLEKSGRTEKAMELFKKAASSFFEAENYADLQYTLSCMDRLAPGNPCSMSYEGKLLFQEGKILQAFSVFKSLRESGDADSSIDFLYALILANRGEREKADEIYAEVIEKEPEYYLYWFRYAENLYFLGKDASKALEKAIELKGDDPWVLNLAGLIAREDKKNSKALSFFKQAFDKDSGIPEIRINYSQSLFESGDIARALALVENEDCGTIINQRGNLLAETGRLEDAALMYRKASALEPGNRIYRENYADVLIKLDRLLEAEEILARLLEEKNEPSVLQKMAFIAEIKGEFRRAEAAYQESLKLDPADDLLKIKYADFLVGRHNYKGAFKLLERISDSYDGKDTERILDVIRQATEERYECSICHREWWVPKVLPEIRSLRLYGEPDPQSPAGKCPSCGKVYCVACAINSIRDNRFTCSECGVPLKLSENYLRYLASKYMEKS